MPELKEALERIARQVSPEPDALDRVRTRRSRRERTRRAAAVAVALAVAIAGVATGATLLSGHATRPVVRPSRPAPPPTVEPGAAPVALSSLRMVSPTEGWATSR